MDTNTTLRDTLDLIRAHCERTLRRHGKTLRQGHPRGYAYCAAYFRRYDREKKAGGGDYAKASPALICLTSRLIDLIEAL